MALDKTGADGHRAPGRRATALDLALCHGSGRRRGRAQLSSRRRRADRQHHGPRRRRRRPRRITAARWRRDGAPPTWPSWTAAPRRYRAVSRGTSSDVSPPPPRARHLTQDGVAWRRRRRPRCRTTPRLDGRATTRKLLRRSTAPPGHEHARGAFSRRRSARRGRRAYPGAGGKRARGGRAEGAYLRCSRCHPDRKQARPSAVEGRPRRRRRRRRRAGGEGAAARAEKKEGDDGRAENGEGEGGGRGGGRRVRCDASRVGAPRVHGPRRRRSTPNEARPPAVGGPPRPDAARRFASALRRRVAPRPEARR